VLLIFFVDGLVGRSFHFHSIYWIEWTNGTH